MSKINGKLISLDEAAGTTIHNGTLHSIVEHAGLDFEVARVPACDPEGRTITKKKWVIDPNKERNDPNRFVQKDVPIFYLLRRKDNKTPLGMVRERYNCVPAEKMLEPFHAMVSEFNGTYETAGLIDGGKKAWVAAKLPGTFNLPNRPKDTTELRIMLLLAFDGMARNAYFTMLRRVFCCNQFHYIMREAKKSEYSVKHSKNWELYLRIAQENFKAAIQGAEQFSKVAEELDEREMAKPDMVKFAEVMLPYRKDEDEESTRIDARRGVMVDLFSNGAGNLGATRWDAFNAVTQFLDHEDGTARLERGPAAMQQSALQRRFVSNLLNGPGDQLKQRALRILTTAKTFNKASVAAAMN